MKAGLTTQIQRDAFTSPWSWQHRALRGVWLFAWLLTCRWTPKPLNRWRLFVLSCFGAQISGRPFVDASVRIHFPPHLTLHDRACLGERAVIYNLAPVVLHTASTVAQEAFLCTGTHDFSQRHLPVTTGPITLERNVFIGARAFVLPGITIGASAVVGAAAVVTRNVDEGLVVAGNPARVIGERRSTDVG